MEQFFSQSSITYLSKPDVPRRLALSNFEHLVSLSSEHRTHRQTDRQLKTLYGSLSKL